MVCASCSTQGALSAQIVDFIADNPTLSYYINYWASSVTELTEEGPVTDVDGDASAAAQMLPERPSGGTRGSLGMEAMTAAMRGPCSRAGVTCVGVFIGDAGAISSIDTSSSLDAAESTYAADFKSSVGRLAVFFVDEDLDAPEAAIAEDVIASAGLYSAGTDFGVLGTLLGNLVAQVCPCPSDPALAVDDPGCGPADEPAAALTPELPPAMPTEAEAPAFADDFPMEAPVSAPDAEERGALPPAAGPSPAPAVDAGTSGQGAYGSYGGSGASPAEDDMGGGYGGTDALEQCIETCYNSYGA